MTRRTRLFQAAAIASLVVLAGLSWRASDRTGASAERGGAATSPAALSSGADSPGATGQRPAGLASAVDAKDAFLSPSLRHRLEALLLEAGEAPDAIELKQRVAALVGRHFAPEEATRASQLADRWIDYRVALSKLKPPADISDPHALRAALDARQRERQRHFTPEEGAALFAQEEELDRFTIARVEIARNPALSAEQKQLALRAAEAELGADQRAARADAVLHLQVAAQSAAYDAAQVDEQQRFRERAAAHGEAAAQRLAQLDRDEAQWQARLARYAAASVQDRAALKDQLFSADEQQRLEGALALRQLKR